MQQTVVIESLQPAIPGAGAGDPVGSPADGIGRRSPGGSRDPDHGQEAGLRLVCSQPLEHQGREAVPRDHLHGCGPGSGCGTHCRYRRPRGGPPVGLQPGSLSRVGQKRSACKVRMEGFPAAAGPTPRRPRSWPDASTMTFNLTTGRSNCSAWPFRTSPRARSRRPGGVAPALLSVVPPRSMPSASCAGSRFKRESEFMQACAARQFQTQVKRLKG